MRSRSIESGSTLIDAQPPIWRRLDLRSSLPLDVVHQVLQVAFDWTDSHLHRFSLGGHPFDNHSQLFLCPYDVEEGELEDDDGPPASEVRLDETLQQPGDVPALRLRLRRHLGADPPTRGDPSGKYRLPDCNRGRRSARRTAGGLRRPHRRREPRPKYWTIQPVSYSTRPTGRFARRTSSLREYGVDQRLVDLVNRLRYTSVGEDLAARMISLISEPATLRAAELTASLHAYRWFLDRAKDSGIRLTSAGYLKPADVEAASKVVPVMGDWIGANNREVHAVPLLHFRQTLQSMGLLRKHKGTLVLTRVGAAAQRDPAELWNHLAHRLPPGKDGTFESHATLLLLAYAATSNNSDDLPLDQIATALTELGWRHPDGRPVGAYVLYRLPAFDVLINISDKPVPLGHRRRITPAAATLARAALCHQRVAKGSSNRS